MDEVLKLTIIATAVSVPLQIALYKLITWSRDKFFLVLSNRDPRLPSFVFNLFLLMWIVAGIVLHYYVVVIDRSIIWLTPAFLVWSFLMVYYLFQRRSKFKSIGINSADRQISKGIDYRRALSLCRNKLRFLGVAAAKLTREDEFEKAIRRCRQEGAAQFLLCKPTHEMLVVAARRYGVDREEYQRRAKNSLRKIAELKEKYANIEVRFYKSFQMFRLMFIDDNICLVSYNVMGEGDGSQLPQLHLVKVARNRDVYSFYYPFEKLFMSLWTDPETEAWDYKKYLNE